MAVEYFLFTGLEAVDLQARLDNAAKNAGGLWTSASAKEGLSRFQPEILAEMGHVGNYRSRAYVRFEKFQRIEAKRKLQAFFRTLPEPKVVLFGMEPTDQKAFLRPIPDKSQG